jgi:hypothetical protein
MVLNGAQINQLADEIMLHSSVAALDMYASYLGITLSNLAPQGSLKEKAVKLITHLNGQIPPKIDQFLELLVQQGNAALRAAANQLLKPTYYSPTNDAHDAIILGRTAFVARDRLRELLRDFTVPSHLTTHVLVVRGDEPGGKSYSWQFLRHLAISVAGAQPMRLRLSKTSYTPREFFEQVYLLLDLDPKTLPELKDDPQLARIDPLINAFKGKLNTLAKRYWLVIDDLNDASVTPAICETVYALASSVEEIVPANLWVALLGYNEPIADPELRHVASEDAEFPTPEYVAKHLELVSKGSPNPLTTKKAEEIASMLFGKFPKKLDKEAMIQMTNHLETLGEKLKQGLQP